MGDSKKIIDRGADNIVTCGANIELAGAISGNNNVVTIGASRTSGFVSLAINGNNNRIFIDPSYKIAGLQISCGNHVPAHDVHLTIGEAMSWEDSGSILLYNSGNVLNIGADCLISRHVTIRCGESPHLIFDAETGNYLDESEGVFIGNHVWIGEKVYITKRVTIPNNSIVAACSVVTSRFDEEQCALGGNPARVVRRQIHWVRNEHFLPKGSVFEHGFKRRRMSASFNDQKGTTDA